jgi:hypothetical protein
MIATSPLDRNKAQSWIRTSAFFFHKKLLDSDLLKPSTLDDSVFNATATPSGLLL